MTIDRYRKLAGLYDTVYLPGERGFQKAGLKLYPPRDNITILDVGCGTGAQLTLYKKKNCNLCGVDVSPAMLDVARRKLGDKADLRLEDASKTSFPDRFFDLVLIEMALHEMDASLRLGVLLECKRVVKPDGRILLIDYAFGPYSFPIGYIGSIMIPMIEKSAGREHYAGFCDFKKRGGMDPIIAEAQLKLEKRVSLYGIAMACLLQS